MSYQVKYNHNGVFRRATIDALDIRSVKRNARQLFNVPNCERIVLTWVDEEGDEVHVSSPAEFKEFLRFFGARRAPSLVKFGVRTEPKPDRAGRGRKKTEKGRADTSETCESDSSSASNSGDGRKAAHKAMPDGPVLHRGVVCSGCGARPIEGIRYKCAGRDDYNLCSACESTTEHPFPMLKMAEPRVGARIRLKGRGFGPNINRRYAAGAVPIPTPPSEEGPAVHDGVSCSKCRVGPIIGLRYKCTGRAAYDLCERCEASEKHTYPLIKMYRPDPTVFVKGWGTGGEVSPANPFGLKTFPAPKEPKAHKESRGRKLNPRAEGMLQRQPNDGLRRRLPMVRFAGDVTAPDGSVFSPSVEFTKTWLVRNDGTSDWDVYGKNVRLISAGGDLMCDPGLSIPVQCLKIGEEGCVSVNLKAPIAPGRYVAYFRIQGGDGMVFGQKLWADIVVRSLKATQGDVPSVTPALAAATVIEEPKSESAILPVFSSADPYERLGDGDNVGDDDIEGLEFVEEDFDMIYPPAVPISAEDAVWAAEREEMERIWKAELDALSAMGFNDTRRNVQVLKEHLFFSSAQQPEMRGKPLSDSMSAIIDALVR